MNKLYILIVAVFCLIITSCSTMFNSLPKTQVSKQNTEVLKVYTGDAGLVYFSEKYPGKIIEEEITGVQQVPFELFSADSVVYRIKGLKEKPLFVYSNGNKYDVFRVDKKNLVYTSTLIRVPVSDISYIVLKEEHKRTALLSGFVIGLSAVTVYIITNMSIQAVDTL